MKGSLYSKFTNKKLALGEHLAAAQAILANERTYLAYLRTALTLFAVGVTFIKFFESAFIGAIGIVFIPAGIFTWAFGHLKYRKMKALIHDIEHNNGD
ncbi:MAG TPA: DUF202 domain-containing protein [Patescibacteria group bacterium]|nr:DUF202 domain-containing protein [Patescibacteria group bacterium]